MEGSIHVNISWKFLITKIWKYTTISSSIPIAKLLNQFFCFLLPY
jgi:hypothetical protein